MRPVSRVLAVVASLLLAVLYVQPMWRIDLRAPQYPEGLGLRIWINQIRGAAPHQLESINGLNHYIGMAPIVPDQIPELRYMPYIVGGLIGLGLLGLIGEPPLIVLDEPMNGLDPLSAFALKQHLVKLTREHGCAVLLATHALEVAERFISRCVLLLGGKLVHDWDSAALDRIRHDPDTSLEQVMVEAIQRESAPAA